MSMKQVQLSVIIPVYKVGQTLDRCVESVLRQQVPGDMEVILVDDGSPDDCPQMCDAWARRDGRIRVVHQDNRGLGGARNAGLDICRGAYVTFADSDDFLAANTYQPLMQRLAEHPEVDVMEYEFCMMKDDTWNQFLKDAVYRDARQYWMQTRAWWHSYAWNKIFRRECFEEVRFADRIFCEDMHLLVRLLEKGPVVATAHLGTYYYIWNEAGLSASPSAEKIRQLLETQMYAWRALRMTVFSPGAPDFLRSMLYRQADLYQASGEVLLRWPFVRLICWLHGKLAAHRRKD